MVVLAAGVLWLPAAAGAATACELSSGVLDVAMPANGDEARLGVAIGGTEILVLQNGQVDCTGATPTVDNTNAISIHNAPGVSGNDVLLLESSRFAPGLNTVGEGGGAPEIEIFVNLNDAPDSELRVDTAFAGSSLVFGTGGINPNATFDEPMPDADIFPTAVPVMRGFGNPAADFISAAGGPGTGGPLPGGIELFGASGNDTIAGGDGPDIVAGSDGGDNVLGGEGPDQVLGGPGLDTMTGGEGADLLDGGPGANVGLFGNGDNDRLVPGAANDQITGGAGTDEVDYSVHLGAGMSLDLGGGATEIENVIGTNFADVLRGDDGPNVLLGLQGNDVLEGRGAEDAIGAGPGDDSLEVRDGGPDTADCGPDADTVTADALGIDTLTSCESAVFPLVDEGGGGGDNAGGGDGNGQATDFLAPSFIVDPTADPAKFQVDPKGPVEQPVALAKKGTTFRFTLSEAATVTFAIERRTVGRRVQGECVKKKPANANRKKCVFFKPVGAFGAAGVAGENAKPFSGRIGKKTLGSGRYRTLLTALDAAGNRSQPAQVSFKVLRPKKEQRG